MERNTIGIRFLAPFFCVLLLINTFCNPPANSDYVNHGKKVNVSKYLKFFGDYDGFTKRSIDFEGLKKTCGDSLSLVMYNLALYSDQYIVNSIAPYFRDAGEIPLLWYVDLLQSPSYEITEIAVTKLYESGDTSIAVQLIPLMNKNERLTAQCVKKLLSFYMVSSAIPALVNNEKIAVPYPLSFYSDDAVKELENKLIQGVNFPERVLSPFLYSTQIKKYFHQLVDSGKFNCNETGRSIVENGDTASIGFLLEHADNGKYEFQFQLNQYAHLFKGMPYPITINALFEIANSELKAELGSKLPKGDYSTFWEKLRKIYNTDKNSVDLVNFADSVVSKDTSGKLLQFLIDDFKNYKIHDNGALLVLKKIDNVQKYNFIEKYIHNFDNQSLFSLRDILETDSSRVPLKFVKSLLNHFIADGNSYGVEVMLNAIKNIGTPEAGEILLAQLQNPHAKDLLFQIGQKKVYSTLTNTGNRKAVPYICTALKSQEGDHIFSVINTMKPIDDVRLIDPLLNILKKSEADEYSFFDRSFKYVTITKGCELLTSISAEDAKLAFLPFAYSYLRNYAHGDNSFKAVKQLKHSYSDKGKEQLIRFALQYKYNNELFDDIIRVLAQVINTNDLDVVIQHLKQNKDIPPQVLIDFLANTDFRSNESMFVSYTKDIEERDVADALVKIVSNGHGNPVVLIKELRRLRLSFDYHFLFSKHYNQVVLSSIVNKLFEQNLINVANVNDNLAESVFHYITENPTPEVCKFINQFATQECNWDKFAIVKARLILGDISAIPFVFEIENTSQLLSALNSLKFTHYDSLTTKKLIALISSDDLGVKMAAIQALSRGEPSLWLRSALVLLTKSNKSDRLELIRLITSNLTNCKTELLNLANDNDWIIRLRAAFFLSCFNDSVCRNKLIELTKDTSYNVRTKALWLLKKQTVNIDNENFSDAITKRVKNIEDKGVYIF